MLRRLLPVVCAAALLCARDASAQDLVKPKKGEDIKGKITRLDPQGLVIESGGKTLTLKNDDFTDFILGDAPASLREADRAFNTKEYEKSFNKGKAALEEVAKHPRRDLHKQFILLRMAAAQRAKGDTDAALETLKTLRRECPPNARLRPDSFRESLEIAREKGDAALEAVLQEMKAENDTTVSNQADLELAKIQYKKGNYAGAQEVFYRLAGGGATALATEAKLWQMRCLRALKKLDALAQLCDNVMKNPPPESPGLVQTASVTRGDMILEKAGTDRAKIREALQAYAQAVAAGPPAENESPEDYARALLSAGRCYRALGKDAAKPEAKAEYRNLAIGCFSELKSAYPTTEWGAAAAKELSTLGVTEGAPESGAAPAKAGAPAPPAKPK